MLSGQPDVFESLEEMIGNTPLVRLGKVSEPGDSIYLKLESFNPGGTVKDRTAFALIQEAEASGRLSPGGVIVEPTSGNTGLGLAWLAARRGYRCIFTVTDKVSDEKVRLMRAYGAEVVICPSTVPPEDPDSYYSVAKRITSSHSGAYSPEQYSNPVNHRYHYSTTGPEIWRQTDGRISHLVAGAGTGGTISGAGMFLKEKNPEVQVICADPEGSIYSDPDPHGYLTEGVGEDFFPANFHRECIDRVMPIADAEAFATCQRLTRVEGMMVGGSGGMVVAAALRVSAEAEPGSLIVVLTPDSGHAYLSKIYASEWMLEHGFQAAGDTPSIATLLAARGQVGEVTALTKDASIGEAVDLLRELSLPALPLACRSKPVVVSEIMGSISLRRCWRVLVEGKADAGDPLGSVALPSLPLVGIGEGVAAALERVNFADVVLVADQGRPVGLMTGDEMLRWSVEVMEDATARGPAVLTHSTPV